MYDQSIRLGFHVEKLGDVMKGLGWEMGCWLRISNRVWVIWIVGLE